MQNSNKKKVFDFKLLVRTFGYVKPYKYWFYLSLCLAIFIAFLAPIRPYLIQLTIETATHNNTKIPYWLQFIFNSKNINIAAQLVIWVTIFQLVLIAFETLVRFVFSYITAKLGQSIVKDLRIAVFKKFFILNSDNLIKHQLVH
jgi:ATP-binding cassette subfamily B multidrug efflux pump